MPASKSIDIETLPDIALECMNDAKFPVLATVGNAQTRVRPVSPVKNDRFTIYVDNLRKYGKTKEIEDNPKVELCSTSSNHDQVRITGIAAPLSDMDKIMEIWNSNALLRKFLVSPDNPELIIYRITPNQVRFMREWALEYYDVPIS